jgi:hypothetical protein
MKVELALLGLWPFKIFLWRLGHTEDLNYQLHAYSQSLETNKE